MSSESAEPTKVSALSFFMSKLFFEIKQYNEDRHYHHHRCITSFLSNCPFLLK